MYFVIKTSNAIIRSAILFLLYLFFVSSFAVAKNMNQQTTLVQTTEIQANRTNEDIRKAGENSDKNKQNNKSDEDADMALLAEDSTGVSNDEFADTIDENSIVVSDPFETFNRSSYKMNKKLDEVVLKPVAEFYRGMVPSPARIMVSNFFNNLATPATVANDVLQGDFYYAARDGWRFLINSTIGMVGLVDVATPFGLPSHKTDFGITLAKWGYQKSNYLVVPLWGSSSIRDFAGVTVDYYAFSFYPYIHPKIDRYLIIGAHTVVYRADVLEFQDVLDQAEFDPYVFERNAFIQRRDFLLEDSTEHTGFAPIDYAPLPPEGYLPVNPIKNRV